ncbi:MAG: SLOG family protein [Clostridium sp.]|nr:SLOG family protein [Clostridium sp.]
MRIDAGRLSIPREKTAAFTGRRLSKLPWTSDDDPRCVDFLNRLEAEIIRAYDDGKRYFISGMASGVDSYAAKLVLKLRKSHTDMSLICVFPAGITCYSHRFFSRNCDIFIVLSETYCTGCMQRRNRYMVEHSSELIACYEGGDFGGTAQTVRMAVEAGIKVTVVPTVPCARRDT